VTNNTKLVCAVAARNNWKLRGAMWAAGRSGFQLLVYQDD